MRSLIAGPLDYTERELACLERVVLHAGVFLRRQYLTCIGDRGRGAVDQRFLSRLIGFRHATVLPYHRRECVFHLTSKPEAQSAASLDWPHRRGQLGCDRAHAVHNSVVAGARRQASSTLRNTNASSWQQPMSAMHT